MNNSESRPSNSLFQIARGSGATLSECTFFFKKAHVTKKDFFKTDHFKASRQKEARPSYIRVLFYKEPGYTRLLFDEGSEQLQDMTLQLLVPNSKRLGGYTQLDALFSSKKARTTRRSQKALHGFTQESTQMTLVSTRQDLKEQDEASRTQP